MWREGDLGGIIIKSIHCSHARKNRTDGVAEGATEMSIHASPHGPKVYATRSSSQHDAGLLLVLKQTSQCGIQVWSVQNGRHSRRLRHLHSHSNLRKII